MHALQYEPGCKEEIGDGRKPDVHEEASCLGSKDRCKAYA